MGPHYGVHAVLELLTLSCHPPEWYNYRYIPPHVAATYYLKIQQIFKKFSPTLIYVIKVDKIVLFQIQLIKYFRQRTKLKLAYVCVEGAASVCLWIHMPIEIETDTEYLPQLFSRCTFKTGFLKNPELTSWLDRLAGSPVSSTEVTDPATMPCF